MYNGNPKEEMQELIKRSTNSYETYEALKIYTHTFGNDEFSKGYYNVINKNGPLVSLICMNCNDNVIDDFIAHQSYLNLEIARVSPEDSYKDIIDYIKNTESKYICFFENNHIYNNDKISEMVWNLENLDDVQVLISPRNFVDKENKIIASPDQEFREALKDTVFSGKTFLEYNINNNINLYGNLSTLLVSTTYAKKIALDVYKSSLEEINCISLVYQFILQGDIKFTNNILVSTILQPYKDDYDLRGAYNELLNNLIDKKLIDVSISENYNEMNLLPISKKITFFYTDKGEYYNLEPIADEANRRGYDVEFTRNIKQKAEIGIYCQHLCYPENSKFSVILLHDLAQGHNRWPNIWEVERWNKFDIGILPGKLWSQLWTQCACQYYANPRHGVYELGYPKSDLVNNKSIKTRANELKKKYDFKYDFTVLYAPSWENDEKEDDFVRALASLNVNLLIKQAHWSDEYKNIIDNIKEMRKMHENVYENVYYIEPEESIMVALELCDIVVSDESSVMSEAIMFKKTSIAVTDWLIPDTYPSRFASVPLDYVLKCKKVELRENVEKLSKYRIDYEKNLKKGEDVISNQGNCCKDIMDAIDYFTQNKDCNEFLNKKVNSKYRICSMWN